MQQTGWPANFNDLRLSADVQLVPARDRCRPDPELRGGECRSAAARI